MKLEDVREFFGNCYQFNKITKMHHSNYLNWANQGFIPIKTQIKLEFLSNGALKADLNHIGRDDNEGKREEGTRGVETL